MPVSFTDEQARNNLNGPRHHILFDENHSPKWFDNCIVNQNIIDVPAQFDYDHSSDMIIYHIDDNQVVRFNHSTKRCHMKTVFMACLKMYIMFKIRASIEKDARFY